MAGNLDIIGFVFIIKNKIQNISNLLYACCETHNIIIYLTNLVLVRFIKKIIIYVVLTISICMYRLSFYTQFHLIFKGYILFLIFFLSQR